MRARGRKRARPSDSAPRLSSPAMPDQRTADDSACQPVTWARHLIERESASPAGDDRHAERTTPAAGPGTPISPRPCSSTGAELARLNTGYLVSDYAALRRRGVGPALRRAPRRDAARRRPRPPAGGVSRRRGGVPRQAPAGDVAGRDPRCRAGRSGGYRLACPPADVSVLQTSSGAVDGEDPPSSASGDPAPRGRGASGASTGRCAASTGVMVEADDAWRATGAPRRSRISRPGSHRARRRCSEVRTWLRR